ncbi:CBS domain-containing protein [Gluconacetobacter aggeris]|uniref:CBS domain-containing protein n=1 Tax=Gluconacetobacter aggeris TaxID=1286186 RepID=A0A7W4IUK7_9PROT|nr:CBS domain-containing protein [Gluconacetobacter aggeris]MBB2169355.1 CBS domain-containing protein [Gluconacetobacter aggeris]
MQVKDVMTSPAICVAPTQSITDAIRLMVAHKISGLPVITEKGQLVGILTEGDLMRRSELETAGHSWLGDLFRSPGHKAEDYVHTHGRKVADIMSQRPVSVGPETPLRDAIATLMLHHIRRLPVMKNDQLVGVVSRGDVLRALLPLMSGAPALSDDQSIRQSILKEYQAALHLGGRNTINVDVRNGVVDLDGTVTDERLRTAARVAAENVKGVVSVVDHITCIDPFAGVTIPPPSLP